MTYQWHIFLGRLDPVQGSEQAGIRPVLVVSREAVNRLLPVVAVVPLTSRKPSMTRVFPNEALLPAGTAGLTVDSIVLAYQVRAIDKLRLGRELGEVTDETQRQQILDALRYQLDL